MSQVSQQELDALIERIKALVVKHGGSSDKLEKVRGWYAAYESCPEAGAFVALECAVEKVEKGEVIEPLPVMVSPEDYADFKEWQKAKEDERRSPV